MRKYEPTGWSYDNGNMSAPKRSAPHLTADHHRTTLCGRTIPHGNGYIVNWFEAKEAVPCCARCLKKEKELLRANR